VDAGLEVIRRSDRERAARVRFLYHVEWDDAMLYDLTLNTERLDVPAAVKLIRDTLDDARFRPTDDSRRQVSDLALAARGRAVLLTDPRTQELELSLECHDAELTLTGHATTEALRAAAEEALTQIPGVRRVHNQVVVYRSSHPGL
jgi:hypothetical protein